MSYIGRGKIAERTLFSGTLPAAGAYATSTISGSGPLEVGDYETIGLNITYVSGANNGAAKFYLQFSPNNTPTFYDATTTVTGTVTKDVRTLPVNNGSHYMEFSVKGAKKVSISVAETGVTASAGSAVVTMVSHRSVH